MRPLQLHVQGFMPFRQSQQIDFSGLDLFAIIGPTGSGKSALLDAITFALYGSTPRLGSSGMEALISQSEQGCSVSLEFEVRGERHRVARSRGRRASHNQVTLESWEPGAAAQAQGRWVAFGSNKAGEVNARIQQAVGLDYTAFTRAVLLPQGRFAEFLTGTARQRQELLGELMNLGEIKDMAGFARERSKGLDAELRGLNGRLEAEYADISQERLDGWLRELERQERRGEELRERRDDLNAELLRLRELGKLSEDRARAAGALQAHDAQTTAVRQGAERAQAARRVAGVLPLIDAQEASAAALGRAAAALKVQEGALAGALEGLERAAGNLEAAEQGHAGLPTLEAKAEALKEAEALAARLRRAGGRPDSAHLHPLPWDEEAHAGAQRQAEAQKKNAQERVQLDLQRAMLARQKDELHAEEGRQIRELSDLAQVKREGLELKARREGADAALSGAAARAGVQAHRHLLHLGEACPLCEQTVRALPTEQPSELEELQRQVQTLATTLETLRERGNELIVNTRARAKTLAGRAEQLKADEDFLATRELDLRAAEASIAGDPADTVARYLAGLAARVRQGGRDPAGELRRTQESMGQLRTRLDQARADHARAEAARAVAQAELAGARSGLLTREAEHAGAQSRLQAALEALNVTPAQARAAQLPEAETRRLEAAAQGHADRRARLDAELADLTRRLGNRVFDPLRLTATERELGGLDAELGSCREQAGQLLEMRRSGSERLTRKAELEVQARETAAAYDTWKTLSGALGVSEFQQYLLQEVESRLLSGAGGLLQEISDGRYRLGLEDGDYVVQDLWNAGETRAVRTLSGGETFLASLALAIALSDYLAGNQILGALFLDEGFGTLDPQALEAVAGALENLRTGGRMVGVITHIESLSQRLPSHLLVSKSAAGSSVQRLDGD